jgi:arylsulfatase A-like enzyme
VIRSIAGRLALLGALLMLGCSRPEKTNVLLIGIDTLRADHVGSFGYPRPTTPRLDALCRESAQFRTAISQAPWTLPAFASIMTGLLPSSHRAGEGSVPNFTSLGPDPLTLAEALQRAGYRTASYVSNGWVSDRVGMARGFQDHSLPWGAIDSAEEPVRLADLWLREHRDEPFFLFVHIIEPHQPYAPFPEDAAPFIDPSYTGKIGVSFGGLPSAQWNAADRQRVIDLYDGDVHHADRLVGRVLDTLADLGLTDNTLIVFTADHGEELFDRGGLGHGQSQYDELLHVPLCLRFPHGRYRGRIDEQARTMDIFPTVLEAVGLPVPAALDGVSLMPLVRNEAPPPQTAVAPSEYLYPAPERKAIRTAAHKLIFTPSTGQDELFDLRTDPGEKRNIAAAEPALTAALRAPIEERLHATLEGFHLVARGSRGSHHHLKVQLSSPTPLEDVSLYAADADDEYSLSPDGRRLDVEMDLPGGLLEGHEDQDGVFFRTAADSRVTVRLALDGRPLPPAALRLGAADRGTAVAGPWAATSTDPQLVVPYPTPPPIPTDGTPAVRLSYVHRPEGDVPVLDDKTRANLHALGYLD